MMRHEIRMNKDYARLIRFDNNKQDEKDDEIIRDKMYSTNSITQMYKDINEQETELLPLNCRYKETAPDENKFFIIEEPPRIRTTIFDISFEREIENLRLSNKLEEYGYTNFIEHNKKPYKLRLSYPYIIYMFTISHNNIIDVKLFFRLSPITSKYDYLLIPNLCNLSESYSVCIGEGNKVIGETISEKIEYYISLFWSTPFNFDYTMQYKKYNKISGVDNFLTWAYNTKINPMFIFNIPWINYSTIKKQIDLFGSNIWNNNSLYKNILSIFQDEHIVVKKNKPMINNSFNSLHFGNNLVSVGDKLTFKNKDLYVKDFSKDFSSRYNYINIESEDGEVVRQYKITNEFKRFIVDQLDKTDVIESIEIADGTLVKVNDILKLENKTFKTVSKIRKCIDGNFEILMDNRFYLAKNCKATLFDKENIEYNGLILKQGERYDIFPNNCCNRSFSLKDCILENVEFVYGNIIILFVNDSKNYLRVDLNDDSYKIVKSNELEKLPPIYRIGLSLIYNEESYKTNNGIVSSNAIDNNINQEDFINYCMKDNSSFSIKSFDLDINFDIGDKVVVPDWSNPVSMLKIKTITNFRIEHNVFIIEVSDGSNNKQDVPYAFLDAKKINIGDVRKISTSYKNVRSGMKVKAINKGIKNFPKKDTNIIIGFITDTGGNEPLVLCSNCCTIWFNDLRNFDLISKSDKRWNKLKHSEIDVSKIKLQDGDIFIDYYYSSKCIMHYNSYQDTVYSPINYLYNRNSTYYNQSKFRIREFIRYVGILSPRKHLTVEDSIVYGNHNLHNLVITDNINFGIMFNIGG